MRAINSIIRPSVDVHMLPHSVETLNTSIRQFSKMKIFISCQKVLGQGVFAKCFLGTVGPNKACIKVLRVNGECFYKEANILSCFCYPDVPYVFGVCERSIHKMLVLSFHGINFQSYSLHFPRKGQQLRFYYKLEINLISGVYYNL